MLQNQRMQIVTNSNETYVFINGFNDTLTTELWGKMKKVITSLLILEMLTGCALTHDQVVARAKMKSNSELCMATIQFPQYSDEIAAELAEREYTCDWNKTAAQIQTKNEQDARYRAALQSAAASFNAQPAYQVQQPKPLVPVAPLQLAPASAIAVSGATAYFTGRQQQVQTVTYQSGWTCEYRYLNQTFWRTFVGTCPSSIQVQ